jgi:hypothetical protein
MHGARAEQTEARDTVARLYASVVRTWTEAELFLPGDEAEIEELARSALGLALERRTREAKILAVIGTRPARAAFRRILSACKGIENRPTAAADYAVSPREVASYLGELQPQGGSPVGDAIEQRRSHGAT